MGRMTKFTEEDEITASSPLPSLCEALLFTTMCIVGLPVEVHIKDGSVYSGIFHTASVDNGYGVALKKARMIRKGKHSANVPNGSLIDTLVVLPGDLVQVVAKGIMLPADSISGASTCHGGEAIFASNGSFQGSENGVVSDTELMNQESQVGVSRPQEGEDCYGRHSESLKEVPEANGSTISLNGCYTELNLNKENHARMASNQLANGRPSANDASLNGKSENQFHDSHPSKKFLCRESTASEIPDSVKPGTGASRSSLQVPAVMAPQNPLANRTAKESKLNPGAKVFSPSFPNLRSTPSPQPTVPSMAYVPNNIHAVQLAAPQPEVGIRPVAQRSSWPVKFVPFVNSTAMNTGNNLQYSQPIVGHIATRAQPIRHGAHYPPIQAVPPYIQSNTQHGMFGRHGQLVYVHPVTHDVIQGPAALSQAPHPLLSSHIHVAKHEGMLAGQALQVSVTPPLASNGPQPFMIPSHIQLSQPLLSAMRPVPVFGSNVPYGAKFP